MLLEKKLAKDDVVVVRLTTGEELIGKAVSVPTDTGTLEVSKPLILGMQQNQQGEVGLGFGPFMFGLSDDGTVVIEKGTYMVVAKARDEIRVAYTKATTGLEVPPAGAVIV